jgi:MoxR-like ATPase
MAKTNSLQAIRKELNSRFLERSELIDGMLTALISGEPLIMIGAPGTAKSAICQALCSSIQGKFFPWMLTRFTVPEELFGPFSLKGLENDKYTRVTSGKLPEADVAFIDEVGKASSSISNTLLTILNEKVFYNDGQAQQVPLKVLFGASNEVPQSEELSAFYDRFVIRFFVEAVSEDASIRCLFEGFPTQNAMPTITPKELADLKKEAQSLSLPKDVVDILVSIRHEVNNEGILVSDRKWVQAGRVIRAYSLLQGNSQVTPDDLDVLVHLLWSTPDQIGKVKRIVNKYANPLGEKMLQIVDAVRELDKELKAGRGDAVETFKKVKHASKELEKLGDGSSNPKLSQAQAFIKGVQRYIAKTHLGLED